MPWVWVFISLLILCLISSQSSKFYKCIYKGLHLIMRQAGNNFKSGGKD